MEFDERTLKPTYRLLIGQPGSSNALAIARRLGIKGKILDQAEKLISGKETDSSKLINKVQQLCVDAEHSIEESKKLKSKLKRKLDDTEKEKKKIVDVANIEIESIFKDVKIVVDEFAAAAVNAPVPWDKRTLEFKKRIHELADGTPLARQRDKFIDGISEGSTVFVQSLNCYATVKSINRNRKIVVVESDDVNFKVGFHKISERPFSRPHKAKVKVIKEETKQKKEVKSHKLFSRRSKNFIKNLKQGDVVYSSTLNTTVIIDTINHEKKKLTVKFGSFPTELPFEKISPMRKNQKSQKSNI